jgi:chloride channel 3/4/5
VLAGMTHNAMELVFLPKGTHLAHQYEQDSQIQETRVDMPRLSKLINFSRRERKSRRVNSSSSLSDHGGDAQATLDHVIYFKNTIQEPADFTTIDWARDAILDWEHRRELEATAVDGRSSNRRAKMFDAMQGWLIVALIGASVGTFIGLLENVSPWLSDIKQGYCSHAWYLSRAHCCWASEFFGNADCPSWMSWSSHFNIDSSSEAYALDIFIFAMFGILFAFIAATSVKLVALYAAGSGLAQIKVILGGFIIKGFFTTNVLMVKSFGMVLSIASGLTVGGEGPVIHTALCIGNLFGKIFSRIQANEAKKRQLLSTAAAIGMAAAFNAPIGGVLYSLEEISYYFPHGTMWRSFLGSLIAVIILRVIQPVAIAEAGVDDRAWQWIELPVFILLGVLGVGILSFHFALISSCQEQQIFNFCL